MMPPRTLEPWQRAVIGFLKTPMRLRRERRSESQSALIELAAEWGSASEKERRLFLETLSKSDLPKGWTVEKGQ
ncbi:MAG: hypothetical protein P0Y50_08780 [Candidatus Brevundimonas colombiensis]|uniref:Uncharacterized protein n=1 Tax=Candidatus Brevundimonas colombiensis TaxID=3121376 RepID=A0AAJ6BKM9_9CAUL|nr:hypothetical protein [Brevundimonas sp.]WEK38646.1 MAG: hypothetical protein P0Y50_08780 [Brevundimonas sp.]